MGRFYTGGSQEIEREFKAELVPWGHVAVSPVPEAVKKSPSIRLSGENRGPGDLEPLENSGFRLEFTPYCDTGPE